MVVVRDKNEMNCCLITKHVAGHYICTTSLLHYPTIFLPSQIHHDSEHNHRKRSENPCKYG